MLFLTSCKVSIQEDISHFEKFFKIGEQKGASGSLIDYILVENQSFVECGRMSKRNLTLSLKELYMKL